MNGIKCLLATAILALLETNVVGGTPCERTSACLPSPVASEKYDGDTITYNITVSATFSNGDENTQLQEITRKFKTGEKNDAFVFTKGYIESMGTASKTKYYQKIEASSETHVFMEDPGSFFKQEGNGTLFVKIKNSLEPIGNVTTFGSGSSVVTNKNTSFKYVTDNTLIIRLPGSQYKVSITMDADTEEDENGDTMASGVQVTTFEPDKESDEADEFTAKQIVVQNIKVSEEGIISGEGEGTQMKKDGNLTFKLKMDGKVSKSAGLSHKREEDLVSQVLRTMVYLPKL